MPTTNSPLRHALEDWFDRHEITPRIVGEFEDSALMKVFGRAAGWVFPAPAAIAEDVARFYGGRMVGRADAVRERYYVISAERRLTHPGVLAMTDVAGEEIFRSLTPPPIRRDAGGPLRTLRRSRPDPSSQAGKSREP